MVANGERGRRRSEFTSGLSLCVCVCVCAALLKLTSEEEKKKIRARQDSGASRKTDLLWEKFVLL